MATIPLSGTNIRLLSGIPFSNDYQHTRWFDSSTEQYNWFLSKTPVHSMAQASFQRQDNQTFIRVNKKIDALYGVNYVMFQNEDYSTKWFFGFVTRLEYKNDSMTHVHVQIDLFQTWKNRIQFQPSFVVREHRPLWQADGRPVVNTVDEGLAYGLDYDTVSIKQFQPFERIQFMVIVCKTPMHEGADANAVSPHLIGMPQPLTYYVIPYVNSEVFSPVILNGDKPAIVPTVPTRAMEELYKNEKAVNNIVSIYITEDIGIPGSVDLTTPNSPTLRFMSFDTNFEEAQLDGGLSMLLVKKASSFQAKEHLIEEDKYSDYVPVRESKLLMYPYTTLVLDDFKGNRVAYKNEYINGKALSLLVKGSLGLSNFVSYGVNQYNHGNIMDNPLYMDLNNESALLNNTPNDVTVINDYLTAFLQGNQNQIKNQETSILFNGIMNGITSGASAMNAGGLASESLTPQMNPMGVVAGIGGVVQGAGNTVIELQGIQAKQKDIANVPPSIQKMGSNTAYNMGNNYNGIYIIKKQIKAEYRRKLTDFFNLYGYKTNEVKIPNFHTRRYWNYVQTKGCVILGEFNAEDLTGIKKIFDNGITLWHTDQIGNYELENEVI